MARKKKTAPIWLTVVALVIVIAIVGCFLLHKYGYIDLPFLSDESGQSVSDSGNGDGSVSSVGGSDKESADSSSNKDSTGGDDSAGNGSSETTPPAEIVTDALSIHFPFIGNKTSGDCTLIKVGNTEVLIDAGATKGSAETIVPYIQQYCTDGVLEYVIATHAHEDHIAAFVGSSSADGIFESFECETIIDFPKTTSSSQIYKSYVEYRDAEVAAGAVHYTALECYNNANGAQRSYRLGDDVTLNILYQKYYESSTSNENNNSVCVMITQGDNNYLFTGDLEHSGEKSLVESNGLPKCTLYKAGHHGSNTASSAELLSVIQPEIVVACCCCGDTYNFPHQEFIDNISVYTDRLYIQAMVSSNGYTLLNGNIVVSSSDGKTAEVNCSNNNTLFKDTDWFKANRATPQAWQS